LSWQDLKRIGEDLSAVIANTGEGEARAVHCGESASARHVSR
jgi:hypothetical protein